MKAIFRLLVLPGLAFAHATLAEDMLPGSWKVEMTVAMGSEAPAPAPGTTVCLKSADELVSAGSGCTAHTTSTSGNRVEMNLACDVNGLKMNGSGSLTVTPTKVDGTLNLAMQIADAPPMQSVSTLTAVRVGDCQK